MQNKSNPTVDQLNDNEFEFEYSDISKIVWNMLSSTFVMFNIQVMLTAILSTS